MKYNVKQFKAFGRGHYYLKGWFMCHNSLNGKCQMSLIPSIIHKRKTVNDRISNTGAEIVLYIWALSASLLLKTYNNFTYLLFN